MAPPLMNYRSSADAYNTLGSDYTSSNNSTSDTTDNGSNDNSSSWRCFLTALAGSSAANSHNNNSNRISNKSSLTVFQRRQMQLQHEHELDGKLAQLPCHQEVSQLLFFMRQVNRRQTQEISLDGLSIFRLPTLYSQFEANIDEVDSYNQQLLSVLASETPCQQLRQMITRLRQPLADH